MLTRVSITQPGEHRGGQATPPAASAPAAPPRARARRRISTKPPRLTTPACSGADTGGHLHHLDQPAVHRQQARCAGRWPARGRLRWPAGRRRFAAMASRSDSGRTRPPSIRLPRQQQGIGQAVGQGASCAPPAGERAIAVEAQQMLQGEPDCGPGGDQHQPVVGQQQQVRPPAPRRAMRRSALPRLALEVARRERRSPCRATDQHRHPGAGGVPPAPRHGAAPCRGCELRAQAAPRPASTAGFHGNAPRPVRGAAASDHAGTAASISTAGSAVGEQAEGARSSSGSIRPVWNRRMVRPSSFCKIHN